MASPLSDDILSLLCHDNFTHREPGINILHNYELISREIFVFAA